MSSMVRIATTAALIAAATGLTLPLQAEEASYAAADWDRARASLVAQGPGRMAPAIREWQRLSGSARLPFNDYANFLLAYPGFPDAAKLQEYAEARLSDEAIGSQQLVAFFDRYPPVTNPARANYALALMSVRPAAALEMARAAWRQGEMNDPSEAAILATYGQSFSQADHDARMDALLWQRQPGPAARQLGYVSPERREAFQTRLAILQGGSGASANPSLLSDPGYIYNRSRELRLSGRAREAVSLLATRPRLASLPFDRTAWVSELLAVARIAGSEEAQRIAASIDDGFADGAQVADMGFKLRDDYTTLMWLGGTNALWQQGDPAGAAPLFYRYGAAARTPQTRSKGFFWAGNASQIAGNQAEATRYYEMAAAYPDRFYGQLALDRLGRSLPSLTATPQGTPSEAERRAFIAAPLTSAVAEVARDAPWSVGIKFYREIASQARTMGEHLLVAELARDIGRRDLAVILADSAGANGYSGFTSIGYPAMVPPAGTNWTLVHAISRQESQFAQNAVSHAGARGLMQLMPGTAREEAGKAGVTYLAASLIDDPAYNILLGSNHIERLLARYNGSYPLAIAAYNAGPGNVNKWLRENGDPRTGAISWIDWIEKIGFFETKNYVHRVLENAVVYEALHPDKAPYGEPRTLSTLLR